MGHSFAGDDAASHGNNVSLRCLNDVIDSKRDETLRGTLARDIGKSEPTFSKMANGTQAFGLLDFERLPRDLQIQWMKRYGFEALGVRVVEIDHAELVQDIAEGVERLNAMVRLMALPKAVPLKVDAYGGVERRKTS